MSDEKIFAEGFVFKQNPNAPDFVVGRLSVKVDEAIQFLKSHEKGGWVNLQIKKARSGSTYVELDTFDPKSKGQGSAPARQQTPAAQQAAPPPTAEGDDDLPF